MAVAPKMMVGVALGLAWAMVVMIPEVAATRWQVGANRGWTTNVNYTIWAQDKLFINGDWLCMLSLSLSSCSF